MCSRPRRVSMHTRWRRGAAGAVFRRISEATLGRARLELFKICIKFCPSSICTACFVVWRPRRAADTSTNQRQGFLCRRTASMEHAADTVETTIRSITTFRRRLKTFLFQSAYGHRED